AIARMAVAGPLPYGRAADTRWGARDVVGYGVAFARVFLPASFARALRSRARARVFAAGTHGAHHWLDLAGDRYGSYRSALRSPRPSHRQSVDRDPFAVEHRAARGAGRRRGCTGRRRVADP